MQAGPTSNDDHCLPYRPLLLVAIAVGLGIVADRCWGAKLPGGIYLWWTGAILLALICVFLQRRRAIRHLTWALLLTALCAGGAWHHLRWNYFAENNLGRFARESPAPVCVEAMAVDRIRKRPAPPLNPLRAIPVGPRSETLVRITRIRDGTVWHTASGDCRLRVAGELSGVNTGDRLRVFARFGRPQPALNPGQYDWAQADRQAGRHSELFCQSPACVTVINSAGSSWIRRWLESASRYCERQLSDYVGPEESGLAMAILLGARERINDASMQSFLKTGTVHLLVVSGLHVGLLALAVWLVFQATGLPRRWVIVFTALLVIVYAAIVGVRPPVMRASILVLLGLFALVEGRQSSVKVVLAAAALLVLAYNPSELFRGGTQLSFLSVATLATFGYYTFSHRATDPLKQLILDLSPWYRKLLSWQGNWFMSLALASLVIWVATAPLVAYHFHVTTPIGVAITPIIWPLVAGALVTGLGICIIGWILPPLAYLLGALCGVCLNLTESIVGMAEHIDLGHFFVPGPAVWWLLVFYGALALVTMVPRLQMSWSKLTAAAVLWVAVGLVVATAQGKIRSDDPPLCTFLAMGHGTCVVLELPGGQTVLYDAGSLSSPEVASETVASYLWSRGITSIDAVVLSHADVDHYNAMPGLLGRFEVGVVYVSPLMFDPFATDGQLDAPNFLRKTLLEAGVPLREIWMNDRLDVTNSEVDIEILHPPRIGVPGRDNANSILLSLRYRDHTVLLPGDLETPGIEAVMAEPPFDCDVLLAPHHGSSRSDPPGFAAWCTPEWVVVSGEQNPGNVQFTAASYRKAGAQVLQTAHCGAVQFTLSQKGIETTAFRGEKD